MTGIQYVICAGIAILFLLFLGIYCQRGFAFFFGMKSLNAHLKGIKTASPADLAPLFASDIRLSHLWNEYRESLHAQESFNAATGQVQILAYRATVPAETFFNTQAIIEGRLGAEFFKHVPGILTGLGILGTFMGLIQGLNKFQISDNTAVVHQSLDLLLQGVHQAFTVSAAAIGLAMVMTFTEKLILTRLSVQIEQMTALIDSMFKAGAGEEYLSRLVKASEESADQSKILKDALIEDLEGILTRLTEQQIQAQALGNTELGNQIVESLRTGLQEPLNRIAGAVHQTTQEQSGAVTQLLGDVLAAFSQRLEDLFGGQIQGINQMHQQTMLSMQTALAKFEGMADTLENAGSRSSEKMAEQLSQALQAMEARQQIMNERMGEFVEQIRTIVRDSQSETHQKLQESLSQVGDTVRTLIGSLEAQSSDAASAHAEREERITGQVEATVGNLGEIVSTLTQEIRSMAVNVRTNTEAMSQVTTEAISRINTAADTLYIAAHEFGKAGQGMSGVFDRSIEISDKLVQAASNVSAMSQALQGVVADHKTIREDLSRMVTELRATVETAKKEAQISHELVAQIDTAAQRLAQAQKSVDEYLAKVSQVLDESHQKFSANLSRVLGDSYTEFYDKLSRATSLLRDAIENLGDALGDQGGTV